MNGAEMMSDDIFYYFKNDEILRQAEIVKGSTLTDAEKANVIDAVEYHCTQNVYDSIWSVFE